MFNQHAQVAEGDRGVPWRRPVASLNYLLTSHVWRQDHNGFSHQDPGFIDHVVEQEARGRPGLPAAGRRTRLLSVADHGLRSRDYVNVIVAGKQPRSTACRWTTRSPRFAARISDWASTTKAASPTSCSAVAGGADARGATLARLSCASTCPRLKVQVINVVDLMRLDWGRTLPHGLSDPEFDALFATSRVRSFSPRRLPVADPPPRLRARPGHPQPSTCAATRRRTDDDAVRHGHAQRPRPDLIWSSTSSTASPTSARARQQAHLRQEMQERHLRARAYARASRRRPRGRRTGPGPLTHILVVDAGWTRASSSRSWTRATSTPVDDFVEAGSVGRRIVHFGDIIVDATVVEERLLTAIEEDRDRAATTTGRRYDTLGVHSRRSRPSARCGYQLVLPSVLPEHVQRYTIPED